MEKTETYHFHQTPSELAKDILIKHDSLFQDNDVLYEPFRGEGAFFNHFPSRCVSKWAEIVEGKDYKIESDFDWVITNPPFRLEGQTGRRNAFFELLDYFSLRAKKGIIFLGNDYCLDTITPKRQQVLKERGWGLTHITSCNIKKWRGRYYVLVFQKNTSSILDYFQKTY